MPYIYTLAGDTWLDDSTIMRALEMDFASDPKVRDIADEYMFGPAFLVSPVYEYHARTARGLPARGRALVRLLQQSYLRRADVRSRPPRPSRACRSSCARAPSSRWDRRSSTPARSLMRRSPCSCTRARTALRPVRRRGDQPRITSTGPTPPFRSTTTRRTGTLTIGRRSGQFPGMQQTRTFLIRWITPQARPGDDFTAPADSTVEYSGAPIRSPLSDLRRGAEEVMLMKSCTQLVRRRCRGPLPL